MPKVNKVKLLSERTSGAPPVIFSITRRYRSDEMSVTHSLTDAVIVRIDLTDVTLVSADTYKRLYLCYSWK